MKKNVKILMVDYDPTEMALFQELLGKTNIFKFSFLKEESTSFLGHNTLDKKKPDIIILNLDLPDYKKNIQLFKLTKAQFINIPIIITTPIFNEKIATFTLSEGALDCLVKDTFDENLLTNSIIYALDYEHYKNYLLSEYPQTLGTAGYIQLNLKGIIIKWSKTAEAIYGYTKKEKIGKRFTTLFSSYERIHALDFFNFAKTSSNLYQTTQINKNNKAMRILSSVIPIKKNSTKIISLSILCHDITHFNDTPQRLYLQYIISQILLGSSDVKHVGNTLLKLCGEFLYFKAGEIWIWHKYNNKLQLVAKWKKDLINVKKNHPELINEILKTKKKYIVDGKCGFPIMLHGNLLGVIIFWGSKNKSLKARIEDVFDRTSSQISIFMQRKQAENHLLYLSHHDILTGIPNRAVFEESLQKSIAHAKLKHNTIAVLYLDLNYFKQINDSYGHAIGDLILKETAVRLKNSIRKTDEIARMGGDEFAIFLPNTLKEDAALIARKILTSIANPISIGDKDIYINASIGISIYPQDGDNVETLLMHSDEAMYQAKKKNLNHISYSENVTEKKLQTFEMENSLSHALENNEFFLYYQPIVSVTDNKIYNFEALLRWKRTDGKIIFPRDFIPIAEKGHLIYPITNWIINTVCSDIKKYPKIFQYPVAINISPHLFQEDIVNIISQILTEYNVDANNIIIEITEDALLKKTKNTDQILNNLKKMGIKLSLDDFGTGYSSLTHLLNYSVSKIKIDKKFIYEIFKNTRSMAIVNAIIALAHALGIIVVAEGIETQAQLDYLTEKRCDKYQGYLYCEPLPIEELNRFLPKPKK